MCQKPLAPTLAAAEALVAAVGGAVPLMVHENWRFRPYYRRLRAWLDDGPARRRAAGAARVPVERHDRRRRRKRGRRWCASPSFAGLERMLVMEILIHHLDTLRFLLGELAVDAARLERSNERHHARRGRGGDRAAPGGGRGAGVRDRQPRGAGGAAAAERRADASSAAAARRPSMGPVLTLAGRASGAGRIRRGGELCPGLSRHHRAFPRRAGAGRGLRDGAGGQSAHARPGGGGLSQKRLRKRAPGLIGSRAGTSGGWTDDGRVRDCGGGRRGPGGPADRPRARGGHHLRPAGAGDAADRGFAACRGSR